MTKGSRRPFSGPKNPLHSTRLLFLSFSYNCLGSVLIEAAIIQGAQPSSLSRSLHLSRSLSPSVSVASFWRYLCVEISTVHVKFLVFLYIIRLAVASL